MGVDRLSQCRRVAVDHPSRSRVGCLQVRLCRIEPKCVSRWCTHSCSVRQSPLPLLRKMPTRFSKICRSRLKPSFRRLIRQLPGVEATGAHSPTPQSAETGILAPLSFFIPLFRPRNPPVSRRNVLLATLLLFAGQAGPTQTCMYISQTAVD